MAVATEVIRRSMSTLAGLFTKKLPAGIWQFTFDEVGKGMKYVVNGRRYEFMAINGVMGITIDATSEKHLWYVISDDCTVQIEEVGQSANPFSSIAHESGTWEPAITGSTTDPTYTATSVGIYTKILDVVFFEIDITINSVTLDGVGNMQISLPFESSSLLRSACTVAFNGILMPNAYPRKGIIVASTTFITLISSYNNTAWSNATLGNNVLTADDRILITGHYIKA
jgi:hypothetical protein